MRIYRIFALQFGLMAVLTALFCLTGNIKVAGGEQAKETEDAEDEALVLNLAPNWRLANKRHAANEYVLQYLPIGADLKKPAELITVTTVMDAPASLDAKTYILQVKKAMDSVKQQAVFEWRLTKETAKDAASEYALSGHPKIPDQFEIMRVIRGSGELHSIIFHFGKRNVSDTEKERAWAVVNSVKLTPASEAER